MAQKVSNLVVQRYSGAILRTDISGSTPKVRRLSDPVYIQQLQRHNAIVESSFKSETGKKVKDEGGACFVLFPSASSAVLAALRIQRAIAREKWSGEPLELCLSVYSGEFELYERDGGKMDLAGHGINMASRLHSFVRPNQILLNRPAMDVARSKIGDVLPPVEGDARGDSVTWAKHGFYSFKGDMDPKTGEQDFHEICEVGVSGIAPLVAPPGGRASADIGITGGTGQLKQVRDDWGWSHWSTGDLRNELLLVFVHGIFSDADKAWRGVAEPLLRRCERDLDVFGFQFPARLWQMADIETAARDLRTALAVPERQVHRHVIFICHSTGGLVVKAMMRLERSELESAIKDGTPYRQMGFNVLRTRRIVNLDVPHEGGHRLWSRAGAAVYAPVALALRALKSMSPRPLPIGTNRIISQLRHGNKWLLSLERDFLSFMGMLEQHALPRPISVELLAADDPIVHHQDIAAAVRCSGVAVALPDDRAVATHRLRGTHASFKRIKHEKDVVASLLFSQLQPWIDPDTACARQMTEIGFSKVHTYHRMIRFASLVGSGAEAAASESASGRSQAEVAELVHNRISDAKTNANVLLVTGVGGGGKSVCVRSMARRLMVDHFSAHPPQAPVVFFFPLERVKLQADAVAGFQDDILGRCAWDALVVDWCEYVRGIYAQDDRDRGFQISRTCKVQADWVNHQLLTQPAVVVLDGVEEFLSRNALDSTAFIRMLADLRVRFGNNDRLTVVLAVRSTMPGLQDFVPDANDRFVLRTLSLDEAEKLEPGAREAIESVPPHLRELLLVHLVFFRLRKRLLEMQSGQVTTRTSVMRQALESLIRAAGLGEIALPGSKPLRAATMDELVAGLAAIAWEFHSGFFGEMAVDDLLAACNRSRAKAPLPGCSLATDRGSLTALLERSVFFLTKPQHYRILHADWESYLVAEHVAETFRRKMPQVFGDAACNIQILEQAGELLSGVEVTEDLLAPFVAFNAQHPASYAMGNLVALLADGNLTLDGPALQRLIERFHEMNPMAIHVFVSAFGTRVLRSRMRSQQGGEPTTDAAMAGAFTSFLKQLLSKDDTNQTTALTKSLAWCFLEALGNSTSLEPYPPLPEPADITRQRPIVAMICDMGDGKATLRLKHRTLQRSFIGLLYQSASRPERVPTLVHYLYLLLLARRFGGHISDADRLLPPLLSPKSDLSNAVRETGSTVLQSVYSLCCQLEPL